ncbi:MAG: sulfite exporter TauE/SafE family protein [Chloroflexota bacterium]
MTTQEQPTSAAAPAATPTASTGLMTAGRDKATGLRKRMGMTPKAFAASVVMPILCIAVILATLVVAPADQKPLIFWSSLIAILAGLSATAIGVYGGVLVPGLLLLGVDPRFAAAASLFLQVLVIPLGAGAHYRLGNVSRHIAVPLIIGGMIGAFVGPFFAAALPKDMIARLVAAVIVGVGVLVLATIRWGGLRSVLPTEQVSQSRVGGVGLGAGFASGVSGAGWGPIGVKSLILLRIEPRQAIGSSLLGRVFMAASAVVGFILSSKMSESFPVNTWILIPMFAGSVAAMVPGAFMVSRIGREKATVAITLLSIGLAIPTLLFGH